MSLHCDSGGLIIGALSIFTSIPEKCGVWAAGADVDSRQAQLLFVCRSL